MWAPYFPLGGRFAKLPGIIAAGRPGHRTGLATTRQQAGLAWLLARSPQAAITAGTSSATHLDENIAAAVRLPDDVLEQFNTLAG